MQVEAECDISVSKLLGFEIFQFLDGRVSVEHSRESVEVNDKDAERIVMQRGSRMLEDQDSMRIKIQRESRYNEDQHATRIKMQRLVKVSRSRESVKGH